MPEPLPAEVVAARLAETLALCGWEGTDVEPLRFLFPPADGLQFRARPMPPVEPVVSPYGAESSLTGARRRVRDRTHVLTAVLARQAAERAAEAGLAAALDPSAGEVLPGEVDES